MKDNRYPEHIMQMLRQRRNLEPLDTREDNSINALSPSEAFSEVLLWEGFDGYDYKIKSWIWDIFGVHL